MSFDDRLAAGLAHERDVIDHLRARGWRAEPFGAGQLSDEMRQQLKQVRTPVRWLPDIIAARMRVVFIDAKAGRLDTGNHALEVDALDVGASWERLSDCEHFFVFGDLGVFSAADVASAAEPGRYCGAGSGTPYVLVPRARGRDFDNTFGRPLQRQESN